MVESLTMLRPSQGGGRRLGVMVTRPLMQTTLGHEIVAGFAIDSEGKRVLLVQYSVRSCLEADAGVQGERPGDKVESD